MNISTVMYAAIFLILLSSFSESTFYGNHHYFGNNRFFRIIEDVRRVERRAGRRSTLSECRQVIEPPESCEEFLNVRSLDGTCNNLGNSTNGAARTPLIRIAGARYFDTDGLDLPAGWPTLKNFNDFPTPQEITDKLFKNDVVDPNDGRLSLLFMVFGQFVDHDMSITEYSEERFFPRCRKLFRDFRFPRFPIFKTRDPRDGCSRFSRSFAVCQQSYYKRELRQQLNSITSYIDSSNIYGSSEEQLEELLDDNRYLLRVEKVYIKKEIHDLLPFIRQRNCIDKTCFLAGDERSSEHVGLSTMHTIFVREHNRIATEIRRLHSNWLPSDIFDVTRRIVQGTMQKIVFEEFLPNLVILPEYTGYNPTENSGILSEFSTAAFRFGHSLIKNTWTRLDEHFNPIPAQPDVPLEETFFNTREIRRNGIESFVFGYLRNNTNAFDNRFADEILNRLFSNPINPFLRGIKENLIARNIHRGRDHGLKGYLDVRRQFNLSDTLDDIINKNGERDMLLELYGNKAENIDLFVGGILEERGDNLVGPLFSSIIAEQFRKLRDGDRFYFRNDKKFEQAEIDEINKASIARVLCDNLYNVKSIQKNAFLQLPGEEKRINCEGDGRIPKLELSVFKRFIKLE